MTTIDALLTATDRGLYCPEGDFYIDPWRPVDRAVITHGHSDHASSGCGAYLSSRRGVAILRERLDPGALIQGVDYGESVSMGRVSVSLFPAGHMLGSAQVRVERGGQVWVMSGDYKTEADGVCEPFEPLPCHTFITEATYALPIYRWRPQAEIFADIHRWWTENQANGFTSILFAYALGKSQRLLAGLDAGIGPILAHGAVMRFLPAYAQSGVTLAPVQHADADQVRASKGMALVIAPPSAAGSPWLRKFSPYSSAMVSGWMQIRGIRRRKAVDRGFVLSDHADWPGLLQAVRLTGASRIGVTHGYTLALMRWLNQSGERAYVVPTHFEHELNTSAEV